MARADHKDNILGYNSASNRFNGNLVTANAHGSIIERQELGYQHIHKPAQVFPSLDGGVQVVAGVGAWTLGTMTEIIPADTIAKKFDIHYLNFEAASQNDVYELALYSGAAGSEVEIARIRTARQATQSGLNSVPIQIPIQHENVRISARLASANGSNNATLSIFYHDYN